MYESQDRLEEVKKVDPGTGHDAFPEEIKMIVAVLRVVVVNSGGLQRNNGHWNGTLCFIRSQLFYRGLGKGAFGAWFVAKS